MGRYIIRYTRYTREKKNFEKRVRKLDLVEWDGNMS